MMSATKRKKTATVRSGSILESDNQLLTDFMDSVPDVIYFKDLKGRLILVNQAYAKGLGLKPFEIVGKTDFDIFPRKRAERMAKDDKYVMSTGRPVIDKIERATRADGVDNFVTTTKIPRLDSTGKVIGLMGITRDVTKRIHLDKLRKEKLSMEKKLESLEESNKIKTEFISMVSHELRTPLAIIKQLFLLLYNEVAGPINDQQREILVKTRHNVERLKNIIDKLLDMSRLENNRLSLRYSLVNLNDLLRDSESFFKEMAKEKGIDLAYYLPKKQLNIFIDAERVLQVITNLITNAIKFTEQNGKISVEVKILSSKVRVGVIDTGIGISRADVPKVFHKFIQSSKRHSEKTEGLGLGLSIAKELVERHRGEIWIESEPGIGTRCFFTLPLYYTVHFLSKSYKQKIAGMLRNNKEVHVMNLFIINYAELKQTIDVGSAGLFKELKGLIESAFTGVFQVRNSKAGILIRDMKGGRYSVIFPGVPRKKALVFSDLVKKNIKDSFIEHKIKNVFIAVGICSFSSQAQTRVKDLSPGAVNLKEIYIGSEMRRAKRIPYQSKIIVTFPDGSKKFLLTVDISCYGVCFISSKPLKTDAKVRVKIFLAKSRKYFSAVARMAWMKQLDQLPGDKALKYKIGLEFTSIKKQDKDYVSGELKLYYG